MNWFTWCFFFCLAFLHSGFKWLHVFDAIKRCNSRRMAHEHQILYILEERELGRLLMSTRSQSTSVLINISFLIFCQIPFSTKQVISSLLLLHSLKSNLTFVHKPLQTTLKATWWWWPSLLIRGVLLYLGRQRWVLQSWRSGGGRRELTHRLWSAASLVCLFRQMITASCTPAFWQQHIKAWRGANILILNYFSWQGMLFCIC